MSRGTIYQKRTIPSQITVIRHTEKLDLVVTPEELAPENQRN